MAAKSGKAKFEDKIFVTLRSLSERWACSIDYLHDLESRGILTFFYPEGFGSRLKRVRVSQILEIERQGEIRDAS